MRLPKLSALILVAAVISLANAVAQDSIPVRKGYDFLTMPYNKRPLTLYKGELQIDAGYKFAVHTQSFDSNGRIVNLKDNGTGSVYHYYYAELRYGLANFIEMGAETYYLKEGIRSPTSTVVSITSVSTETVTVNKVTESKGMGDLFLYTSFRLPLEYRWFDLDMTGGIFLPTAKYEAQQPTNSLVASATSVNAYTINLKYNNTNGYGVPVYYIGASCKFSLGKFSSEADWSMQTPMKEGTNLRWNATLADNVFSYGNESYSYLLSNSYTLDISLHYQAKGWFNISMNGIFYNTKGGWTEYWGNKYKNNEESLFTLEPKLEIQISPALTIYEVAGWSPDGKNIDAPFYLFMILSYKLFPFLK
ncbi:MAG: hypothetical protein ABSG89_00875 [Bacteroidales bacterium]|jgi:hypothetical protein